MYSLIELKQQNKEISDLIEVMEALVNNKKLITNPFVCDLVKRFNEKVWMHLVFEDKSIYAELAKHHNPKISEIAQEFHNSAKEIKKDFSSYMKLWYQAAGANQHHQAFVKCTPDIFKKIKLRIKFESDKIFPLIES